MSKVKKDGGHWMWTGHVSKVTGQPQFWVTNKVYPASRVAWLIFKGKEPPLGHIVKHKCGKKGCVKPDHLEMSGSKATLKRPANDKTGDKE